MASVNLDTTSRLDITCRQGDTFELTVTLKDSAGSGLNLSTDNYQFLMQVRNPKAIKEGRSFRTPSPFFRTDGGGGGEADSDDALIVDGGFANTDGIIIGSTELGKKGPVNFSFNNLDDNGNVTIFLSASDMQKVQSGKYRYDLQYKVGSTQKTVLEGSFRVNGDVSKANV